MNQKIVPNNIPFFECPNCRDIPPPFDKVLESTREGEAETGLGLRLGLGEGLRDGLGLRLWLAVRMNTKR